MKSIGIIGGGITGVCAAYFLKKDGYEVSIIDEGNFDSGCSYINAGMVVPSHVVPLAAPGVVGKGLKWMLKPDSPFAFHFNPGRELFRWMWLFVKSASKENVQYAAPHLRDISLLSKSLYHRFAFEEKFEFNYAERGLLMLYQTSGAEKDESETARIANQVGITANILSGDQVQRMETDLKVNVRGGIYFPGDAHLDPELFMKEMKTFLKNSGVGFIDNSCVRDVRVNSGKVTLNISGNRKLDFDRVVIACGVKSEIIAKQLSCNLPLEGGKGYSFDLENRIKNVQIPSLLIEGRVAVTPMGNKLRVSGTMEIGNHNNAINMKRVNGILKTLGAFYPELNNIPMHDRIVRYGLRPCSPDGLPYIGALKKYPEILIAAGHGMMGMSLGPATGKLVSEIISEKETVIDISAFKPERFSGRKDRN